MNDYKGTYDGNTLTHYRTPGSKNGRTKYPGKYNPIGELAKGPEFYARMAAQQRQAMSSVNNSMEAYRRAQLANRAAISTAAGPQAMARAEANKSYANAQAKAMQDRNKAYGTAYGQMRAYGNAQAKANAAQRQANINSAKNVGTNPSHPTAQPNKGNYGTPSQQQLTEWRKIAGGKIGTKKDPELAMKNRQRHAEERRIAGGNAGGIGRETMSTMARIKGAAMPKSATQRQAEVMERRIRGGKIGTSYNNTKINSGYDAQKKMQDDQSRRTNYKSLVARRRAEESQSGITANKTAAEAKRIAGSKLGSGYEDRGNSNFKRAGDYAKSAIREAKAHMNIGDSGRYQYRAGNTGNKSKAKWRAKQHVKQAAKEFSSGVAKETKSLVKKGKKKVKKLLKKWF